MSTKETNFSFSLIARLQAFNPDIIHVFLRPNLFTLSLIKGVSIFSKNAKIVLSALQPPQHLSLLSLVAAIMRPNLVFYQSNSTEKILRSLGFKTCFLPSAVDGEKFFPVNNDRKIQLRKKYTVPLDAYVILHVGHINRDRNLGILKHILTSCKNTEVLIVGSMNDFNFDIDVFNDLRNGGCMVFRQYFDHIEELYQLSDCYVFPTQNVSSAIEIPLSVMEAMSCNLPVVSTVFGGLPLLFPLGSGMFYMNDPNDLGTWINTIRDSESCTTRALVTPYSWENISEYVEKVYIRTIEGGPSCEK